MPKNLKNIFLMILTMFIFIFVLSSCNEAKINVDINGGTETEKKEASFVAPTIKESLFYNGENQDLINEGTTSEGVFQYKLGKGEYSNNIPKAKDVGTYTVYYKLIGDSTHLDSKEFMLEVNIEKGNPIIVAPTAKTLTYNGLAQQLIVPGTTTGGTLKYKLGTTPYSEEIPVAKEVGTYNVYYKVFGDDNYNNSSENFINVVISSSETKTNPVVVAPTAKTLTYNGLAQNLINAGSTTGGTLKYKLENGTYSTSIPKAIEEGSYKIYYKVEGNDNYNDVDPQEIIVYIVSAGGKKTPSYEVPSAKTLTYNGTAQNLINAGSTIGGTLKYKLEDGTYSTDIPTATNAGTYTVYYKIEGNDEYNDIEEASVNVTISKATATITTVPTANTITADGEPHALLSAGVSSFGDIEYRLGSTGTYSTDIPSVTEAGEYTVYYKVEGTENYNGVSEQSATVTVRNSSTQSSITLLSQNGGNETAVVSFEVPAGTTNTDYNVYYSDTNSFTNATKIDKELIFINNTTATAYLVGLAAGNYYVKVEKADESAYVISNIINVSAQDRSGYAHFNYTSGIGAYNDDGTLKSNANVIYVTEKSKNNVDIDGDGVGDNVSLTDAIKNTTVPLCVRVIGRVGAATWATPIYTTSSYSAATTSTIQGNNGKYLELKNYDESDLLPNTNDSVGYNVLNESVYSKLNGLTNKIKYDSSKKEFDSYYNMMDINGKTNITVEGIGIDAEIFQWGFTWKNCQSIEVKNLTFTDYPEDACSFEASEKKLSSSSITEYDISSLNEGNIWLHNNTFNIGMNYWDVCSEHDKGDGDGATDFKYLKNLTIAYNHYVGTHKTGLVGGSENQLTANLTFHHNWYEGCKSRLPYARQANMHMYNNYYDSSTGITMQIYAGAYAFIENCYFKNDNKTYDIIAKGYATAAVKSFNNIYDGSKTTSAATVVTDRTATVTNGNIFYSTINGTKHLYSSFDTNSSLFYYDTTNQKSNVSIMKEASEVPTFTVAHAGAGAAYYLSLSIKEVEKHTVTYHYLDENGDVIKASTTAKIDDGVTLLKPANPTVSGYDFDNWYTYDSFDTLYTFGNAITADVDIYAKFTEEVVSPDTIATDTVYSFSKAVQKTSNDIIIDQDTLQNDDPVTVSKLTIDTTSGKFAYNGNGWYQMNTGTILSFKTSKAVEIKVTLYDSKSLTFTGQGLDVTQSNSEHTVVTTAGGEVEILVNDNNTYIGLLEIYVRDLSKVADSLELKTVTIGAGTSTSYTNGTYVATNLKTIYSLNEEFDPAGLYGIVTYTDFSTDVVTSATGLSFDGFSSTTAGEKTIIVSYTSNETVTATLKIYVVDTAPAIENETLKIKVLPSYTGKIGAVNDGYNIFKTINQALDYLRIYENTYSLYNKYIYLAAGTYNEKVEIDIPNLTIEGINKNTTIIEYNSLFGQSESNGFTHVTDSTQTLAVREAATNFTLKNVTVSNYWNSYDRFVAEFGNNNCEHRALAMLIQADKVIVDSCKLLGYQDTLEAFTGRSLFANSYISGATDFIFGTNPTMYFKNCEIHSIYTGTTDGGYINAFKGMNKGDTDYVTYGAIYDGCNFTADSTVTAPNTSIARPWDKYSSVMVMNSTIGTHISTTAYTSGTAKNQRYVCWTTNGSTASEPTTATVKFLEYNNSGSSAISASISGVTVLTETEAANYNNLAVIFGTTNGAVEYTSAWNVTVPEAQQTTTETYEFNFEDGNMVDENGFFTISGTGYDLKSVSSSKTYDGTTYTKALKIDSKPTITFTTTEEMTLTIVAYTSASIDIDGTKVAVDSDFNIIKMAIGTGTHTIKKGSGENSIYAIIVE